MTIYRSFTLKQSVFHVFWSFSDAFCGPPGDRKPPFRPAAAELAVEEARGHPDAVPKHLAVEIFRTFEDTLIWKIYRNHVEIIWK